MDVIDSFLTNNATEERRDLLMATHNQLISLGYLNHELNIQNYVNVEGSLDNANIVMLVENELLNACHDLALSYFVVCRKEDKIKPYLTLLEFLHYLENTIESATLLYHLNDELDARDQLLSWVDVFRNDMLAEISDLTLDVMDSLIDNITEMHELKVDLTPVEPDLLFQKKLQYLKVLNNFTTRDLVAVLLVKSNTLTTTYSLDEIYRRFSKSIYATDIDTHGTALNIVSMAMMSPNDIGSINYDARTLVSLVYDDVKKANAIVNYIDELLNQTGELCKIMNTI